MDIRISKKTAVWCVPWTLIVDNAVDRESQHWGLQAGGGNLEIYWQIENELQRWWRCVLRHSFPHIWGAGGKTFGPIRRKADWSVHVSQILHHHTHVHLLITGEREQWGQAARGGPWEVKSQDMSPVLVARPAPHQQWQDVDSLPPPISTARRGPHSICPKGGLGL
jgi:hypothetical protein